MSGRIVTAVILVLSVAALPAGAVIIEPGGQNDFPEQPRGPGETVLPGCYLLATGTITAPHKGLPGDVDYLSAVVPFDSALTVVDVDITSLTGSSRMEADVNNPDPRAGFLAFQADGDDNNFDDLLCGGPGTGDGGTEPGQFDSVINLGATPLNAILDIGVTGSGDDFFDGSHFEAFSYQVWVYSAPVPEPACLALLALPAVLMRPRRRR